MPTAKISSADFLKSYGRISEQALQEPVAITSHGRPRLVLLSVAEYERLKRNDRQALYPWELSEDEVRALQVAEAAPEAIAFDHELKSR